MDTPFIIIGGLWVINIIVLLILYRKNRKLLTFSERNELAEEISVASRNERWQLWITLPMLPLVILLDIFFKVNNEDIWFRIWIGLSMFFVSLAVFRNRRIHRKLRFPDSFVHSEFYLGFSMVILFLTLLIYSIWQDLK